MRMMVTPELAKQWLEANTHNRPLSEELVIAYMVDMLDGRWQYNGDAIRFDHTGRLIDGQHRLHACIEAGVPFETDVVTGLAPEAIRTIDIGRVRTAGHIAHLEGVENASVACAIAGLAVLHRKYGIERMNDPRHKPTKTEIVEAARTLAGLDAAIAYVPGRLATRSHRRALWDSASGPSQNRTANWPSASSTSWRTG
jgi:hypothetical protein